MNPPIKRIRNGRCCNTPTCESSLSPPYTNLTCSNCGADCRLCKNSKLLKVEKY